MRGPSRVLMCAIVCAAGAAAAGCGRIGIGPESGGDDAPAAAMAIEDAPGGRGAPLGTTPVFVGQTIAAFAVARDPAGGFVEDVVASWSVEGAAATIDIGPSNATHVVFDVAGTVAIQAEHPTYGVARVDGLSAAPCAGDADCADACHAVGASCTDGACVYGPADKDSDGDGFVDIRCLDGTDCDDDPTTCGAACLPGGTEVCDGHDNDCDAGSPDGAAEATVGTACDGSDADTCTDDAIRCDQGALACTVGLDACDGLPIGPVADSYLNGIDPAPHGSDAELRVGRDNGGPVVLTVVQFDLGGYPPGTAIAAATLRLYPIGAIGSATLTVNVHRITAAWDEATVDWANQPAYDPAVVASTAVPLGVLVEAEWDVTAAVMAWIDGAPNHGFYLTFESIAPGNLARFGSREYGEPSLRPELVIVTAP